MEQVLNEQTQDFSPQKMPSDGVVVESQKAEVSFKKFKDVDALLKAYSSLEAEFTKRSQKIKELMRENDEYKKMAGITTLPRPNASKGNDNLKEIINKHPKLLESVKNKRINGQNYDDDAKTLGDYISMLEDKVNDLETTLNDENTLLRHIEGTSIKDGIIREYLKGVLSSGVATRLISGGGTVLVTPPNKPKSIKEAGAMAIEYLKK